MEEIVKRRSALYEGRKINDQILDTQEESVFWKI